MKKRCLYVLLLLLSFQLGWAQDKSWKSLVGRWEAVGSDHKDGGLEVVDSTTVFLVYGSEKKRLNNYKADFSRSPMGFDFVIKEDSTTLQMRSLILFVNDDLIQWQVFQGDVRPAHFVQGQGEMMYLRRKK